MLPAADASRFAIYAMVWPAETRPISSRSRVLSGWPEAGSRASRWTAAATRTTYPGHGGQWHRCRVPLFLHGDHQLSVLTHSIIR
jgi:hypothetical protein